MFLLLNESAVASVVNGYAYLVPAPYLNQYGEIKSAFTRSNILSINKERYDSLKDTVLEHKLFSKVPLFNVGQNEL